MTDTLTSAVSRPDKRRRLVDGARTAFYEHGVERTTLAEIARAADVPPGNVYYYFKTKEELVEAVIASHMDEVRSRLGELEKHRTPKARLKAFVRMLSEAADVTAEFGCPQGTLCSELDKGEGEPRRACAEMLQVPVDWAERQFRDLGRRDARDLAVALIASYQGVALLANAFSDPDLMTRETKRLDRWIDSLA